MGLAALLIGICFWCGDLWFLCLLPFDAVFC